MPLLEKGSMNDVKTGDEQVDELKNVRVRLVAPDEQAKKRELYEAEDGSFSILRFNCEILEGPFKGRRVPYSAFTKVSQSSYLSWNLKDRDQNLLTEAEKLKAWEENQYLSDLKRMGNALEIDFEEQDVVDAYGKECIVNTIQKVGKDGISRTEAKYPRKPKSN